MHGLGGAGGVGALELEAPAPPPSEQQQVEFGSALGCVEVRFPLTVRQKRLLQCESLPARAVARVRDQVVPLFDPQQVVQHPAVAQIDLGRLDQAFAEVLEPWRKDPDHEGPGQEIAIAVHVPGVGVQRACKVRGVPGLSVNVGQHPPQPAQRLRRHSGAHGRDVPFHKGAGEGLHPARPGRIRGCAVGSRETATHPQPVPVGGSHLGQRKATHVDEQDSAGQRLGNAPDQIGGSAAQEEKDRVAARVVADRTQHFEQLRHPLDLVEDHETLARREDALRRKRQGVALGGDLEIEMDGWARPVAGDLVRQSRLAHLACPEYGDHRRLGEAGVYHRQEAGSRERLLHIGHILVKYTTIYSFGGNLPSGASSAGVWGRSTPIRRCSPPPPPPSPRTSRAGTP